MSSLPVIRKPAPRLSESFTGNACIFGEEYDSLVRTFMAGLEVDRLEVAEAKVSNVPGLLADNRVFAWSRKYRCYLERLRSLAEGAYTSDPATCPARPASEPQVPHQRH